MTKKRFHFHRGYMIAAIIIAIVLIVGSLIVFPEWSQSNSGLLVLIVIIIAGVVTFLADFRGAFNADDSRENPTPTTQPPHQIRASTLFVGRDSEINDLTQMIKQGNVIIVGMGGIGKTALALKFADKIKRQYRDGHFVIDLRGQQSNPLTVAEAMAQVIRSFYPPDKKLPDNENELRGLYNTILESKHVLLLLDNAKDAVQIEPLIFSKPSLTIVTSRQNIYVHNLTPKNLGVLPKDKAIELLIKIVPRLNGVIARSAVGTTKQSQLTVNEIASARKDAPRNDGLPLAADIIADLCGYLPLALQVSASTLAERADLQPQDFIRRLSDTQQRLQLIGVDASLQLSYDLLTPELKQTFGQLSVFPVSFDAAAEEAICDDEDHIRLSELVRLSLAQYDETTQRYQLHDLVRLFADKQLNDQERATAQYKHSERYEIVLRSSKELYKQGGDNITRGLALFDLEWNNIKVGQKWAAEHIQQSNAAQLCDRYPDAGAYVLELRLHARDHIYWLDSAINAAKHLNDRFSEGVHAGYLGLRYGHLGEIRRAIEYYEQALDIARKIGDKRNEGVHLGNLGIAYADLGETRKAIEIYEQWLAITCEIGDRRGEGQALGNLGTAYFNLSETRKAIEIYEQWLAITREIGDRRGEGQAIVNFGVAYDSLGETRKAIEFYEQGLAIIRQIGDRRSEGQTIGNLGTAYYKIGESRKAIEFYEQRLIIAREIGDRRGEGISQFNMSLALDQMDERSKAIQLAEAALKIWEQIEDPHAEQVRKQLVEWRKETR